MKFIEFGSDCIITFIISHINDVVCCLLDHKDVMCCLFDIYDVMCCVLDTIGI